MTGRRDAYALAGVDIAAGDRAVELMKKYVGATKRAEVLGGIGGFAGFFDATALKSFKHPVLVTATDGVGTKVAIAQAMGIHHTIGIDLVAMLVDDLVVTGAEPLFMTDYIACGKVVPETIAAIVEGISEGCIQSGCALTGGETAEHPGLLAEDEYDIAGATTGVVEYDKILGPKLVKAGDVVLAMESSGLHSNGYSLVRKVLLQDAKWSLNRQVDDFGSTLGEELLIPTKIYARDVLALIEQVEVHALSHITGGGFANNLARVIGDGLGARVDRGTWEPSAIFKVVQEVGRISTPDIEATLNMGVGMAALLPEDGVDQAIRLLGERGIKAWVCGEVFAIPGDSAQVELVGAHPES